MLPLFKFHTVLPGNPDNAKESEKDVDTLIYPAEIAAVQPCYHWGCMIIMKSGHQFMTRLQAKDMERHIAAYWDHVSKLMNSKDNGKIVTFN